MPFFTLRSRSLAREPGWSPRREQVFWLPDHPWPRLPILDRQWQQRLCPRSQRRDRDGLAPSSLNNSPSNEL
jgi:hypothetical protein